MPASVAQFMDWPPSPAPERPAWTEIAVAGVEYRVRVEGDKLLAKRKRRDEEDPELHIWERCDPPSNRDLVVALLGGGR